MKKDAQDFRLIPRQQFGATFRLAFLISCVLFVTVLLLVVVSFHLELSTEVGTVMASQKNRLDVANQTIQDTFSPIIADLQLATSHIALKRYLDTGDSGELDLLSTELVSLYEL